MRDNYILEGPKVFKVIVLVLAGFLLLISLFYVSLLRVAVLFPVFISGLLLTTIQFHRITLSDKELVVEKYGLVKFLNMRTRYPLNEITGFRFDKGTSIPNIFFLQIFFGSSENRPRTKSDKLILSLRNGNKKFINRIGRRKDFLKLCENLNTRIG